MVEPTIDDACGGRRAIRLGAEITGGGLKTSQLPGQPKSQTAGKPTGTSRIRGEKVAGSHLVHVQGIAKDTTLQIPRPVTRSKK